jgi:hypothetical protein
MRWKQGRDSIAVHWKPSLQPRLIHLMRVHMVATLELCALFSYGALWNACPAQKTSNPWALCGYALTQ